MGSHKGRSSSSRANSKTSQKKRTPRSFVVEEQSEKHFPAIIPESFNFRNFDLVGKIDDMRGLTKELSIMARQLEMWMGVAYTIAMAFKDNGVLREVVKSLSTIGAPGEHRHEGGAETPKHRKKSIPAPPAPPFPFFQNSREDDEDDDEDIRRGGRERNNFPQDNFNIFEIMNNPAFKEIVSKLLLNNKK